MWKIKLLLRRLAAMAYDCLLVAAMLFVATALVLPLNRGQAFEPGQWAYPTYLAFAVFGFIGWFWTHGGQTLGMKAWRLRLAPVTGTGISWRQAAQRFVGAMLSWLCFGFGYWYILFDADGRAWHDRWSRTRVLLEPRSDERSRDAS